MSVKTSAQSLLIKVMSNQTDAATEDKETIEHTHAEVVLSFLWREGATVAEKVNEADSDTTVNIKDEVVFLGSGDGFDGNGVVQEFMGGEVLRDEFLDQLDSEIGIGSRFDTVTDTRD
jgi:hypothetical protein